MEQQSPADGSTAGSPASADPRAGAGIDSGAAGAATGAWRIAVVSGIVLTLELALIRQIPAEVRVISYFTNLILMATFFGLGLGCVLERWRNLEFTVPVGLVLAAGFILCFRGLLIFEESSQVHYWVHDQQEEGMARPVPLFVAAVLAFLSTATPFVGLGQTLARTMNPYPRLVAYGWDIAGSLAGTLLFVAGSYLCAPPWLWPPLAMLVWAVAFRRPWVWRVCCVAAGAIFLVFCISPHPSLWSPYYLVQYREEDRGTRVWVNSGFHQFAVDFSLASTSGEVWSRHVAGRFSAPYALYRQFHDGRSPRRVLILGAGTGNDVNVALANEAEDVLAVEIDPEILGLGERLNRLQPYQDPRVRTLVDDARHVLCAVDETFDLVVFGTLDSQTLLSGKANLRLENYVYTTEAFAAARARLAETGMLAAYYSVQKPWLLGRLYTTMHSVFGDHCRISVSDESFLFNTVIMGAVGIDAFREDPATIAALTTGEIAATDDWPYLYVQTPTVAPVYVKLFVTVLLLIIGVFAVLRRVRPGTGLHLDFLFLGAGFALLEAASVVRLALLFGSTWTVNAAVFASALLMIFAANWSVLRNRAPPLGMAWAGVFLGVAVNFLLPTSVLLALPAGWRFVACFLLVGTPVYFAGVCFSRRFAVQRFTGYALGINLVGVMLGGWLEYLSVVVGMRSVWLLVLAVYLAAALGSRFSRDAESSATAEPAR